jgi:phasin family protein
MITEMQEFVNEQTQALAVRARKLGKAPAKVARAAAANSADGIKSLKSPIRAIARAGVKFTAVSHDAVASLIELESEMLTATMTDVATRLTRAARADGVVDLVRDQTETLRASGERIVGDATRAVEIVTDAGQDIRKLAAHAYESVVKQGEGKPTTKKAKGKRVVRKAAKSKPAARKTVVRRRKKVAKPIPPASRWDM